MMSFEQQVGQKMQSLSTTRDGEKTRNLLASERDRVFVGGRVAEMDLTLEGGGHAIKIPGSTARSSVALCRSGGLGFW